MIPVKRNIERSKQMLQPCGTHNFSTKIYFSETMHSLFAGCFSGINQELSSFKGSTWSGLSKYFLDNKGYRVCKDKHDSVEDLEDAVKRARVLSAMKRLRCLDFEYNNFS